MARIKVVPRKPPTWVLTQVPRPHTPSSAITIRDVPSNPQERSEKKKEATPTSSQEPRSMIKNDVERKDKGKKRALEIPTKDKGQREEDEEETETEGEEEEEDNDPHAKLIDELKLFQQWGLMNKQDPNQVFSDDDDDDDDDDDGVEEDDPSEGQCYELEVKRTYPNFFVLIPQFPHYRGLLHDGVDEGIKKTVYRALWYKLVDLMDRALQTNCLSTPQEIKEMVQESRGLEKLGFDVRHLMARLEQPYRTICDLSVANDQLHSAKKRKHEMEEQLTELDRLEAQADKLKKMLSDAEAKVSRLKAKVGSDEERAALIRSLGKQVEDAEKIFRAKLDIFKSLD